MSHESWITKPKYQIASGVAVILCILAGFFGSVLQIQAERDHRQDAFAVESLARDKEIKSESVRVTCGILKGFDRLTPQVAITGQEDPTTLARLQKVNTDRLAARAILKESMPADIVAECPAD